MNMIQDDEVRLLCPVLASISPGKRYYCRVKIGGEMRLIEVMARTTAYAKNYGKGRQTLYVDVFGYGWSGTIQAKKLLEREKVKTRKRNSKKIQKSIKLQIEYKNK